MTIYLGLVLFFLCFSSEALKFYTKKGLLPTKKECGVESSTAFPWMVFIPAESRMYNPNADIRCAGALISKRYVILNKSCLQFLLTKVHLGQGNVTKNVGVLKLQIEEKAVNENYDIILIRLSEDVVFSDKIRPICLPFEDFKKPTSEDTVYSSGWGLTSVGGSNSDVKKAVKSNIEESCSASAKKLNVKDEICIKVQEESADKPCSGDEGSPIMYNDQGHWILQGIMISLHDSTPKPCAISEAAVGSKITEEVLQWIIEKIY